MSAQNDSAKLLFKSGHLDEIDVEIPAVEENHQT